MQIADPDQLVWFIVHTKADGERLATDALRRKGFEAYMPATTVLVRHARQTRVVSRPLFRRYAFVRCQPTQIAEVRKTWGVAWMVTNVGKPVVIKDGIVEAIRVAEAAGDFDTTKPVVTVEAGLKPGDKAQIADGAYAGMIAEIVAMPSERRIEVVLSKVGQRMKVTTPLANLKVIA